MSMAASLFEIMYTFSSALLYPVIIILVLLVFLSLIHIGEFLSEYSKRHRDKNNLEENCKKIEHSLNNSDLSEASGALRGIKQNYLVTSFAGEAAKQLEDRHFPAVEKLAGEYEIKMARRLEQTKIVATISPMLGLMGTLIPLGPALIGLSQGDIATLANNLMIAFATTVVGLFAGTIGYVLTQVRRRWYWEDMSDIDYIMDFLENKGQDVAGAE
ncbi:MAG: MotA/TolQ/ExbB proton channel family protein [Methanosarcinaceae archaeon]|nr:MotA/TolQ/ExbB proton channel family protein [Methanosarcinaceae archaeon]